MPVDYFGVLAKSISQKMFFGEDPDFTRANNFVDKIIGMHQSLILPADFSKDFLIYKQALTLTCIDQGKR